MGQKWFFVNLVEKCDETSLLWCLSAYCCYSRLQICCIKYN